MSFARSSMRVHRYALFAAAALTASMMAREAFAQPIARDAKAPAEQTEARGPAPDRFFPNAGHVMIAAASGIPFMGIGEVSVGVSDGFTLGLIGGVADDAKEAALGGRLQAALFRMRSVEMLLTVPVLYYPPSVKRNGESWIITNPALLVSGRLPRQSSVYGGLGGVAASCTDDLLAHFGGRPKDPKAGSAMVDGAWNTVHLGGSIATSRRTSVFLDSTLVLSGLSIASSYAKKVGVPGLAEVGVSARF